MQDRRCNSCAHFSGGLCAARRDIVTASAPRAMTCPLYEAREGREAGKEEPKVFLDSFELVERPSRRVAEQQREEGGQEKAATAVPIDGEERVERKTVGRRSKENPLLRVAKLLHDSGFKVVPVDSSKKPLCKWEQLVQGKRLEWEELTKLLRGAAGIAVVGGPGPYPYLATLVVVDVDKPSALERYPSLASLRERTVSWLTGPRCPRCEEKHLAVLEVGRRFRCDKCGIEFTLEEAKRGLGMMVFVEEGAAERYGLTDTKRLGEVELLISNYQLVPPSLHPSGVRYEWLRPPEEGRLGLGVALVTEVEAERLLSELGLQPRKEKEEREGERPPTAPQRLRELSRWQEARLFELLKPFYAPGRRHRLLLSLAGLCAKEGVSPLSVARIAKQLHEETGDEDDIAERGGCITYSYAKVGVDIAAFEGELERILGARPRLPRQSAQEEVKGSTGLLEVFSEVVSEREAQALVELIKRIARGRVIRIPVEWVRRGGFRAPVAWLVIFDLGDRFLVLRRSLASERKRRKDGEEEPPAFRERFIAELPEITQLRDTATGNTFFITRRLGRVEAISADLEGLLRQLAVLGYANPSSMHNVSLQLVLERIMRREEGELAPGFGPEGLVDPYGALPDTSDHGVEGLLAVKEWVERYYPEQNRHAALANVALFAAKLLSSAVRRLNPTFVDCIVWNYGRGGEGKSTLFRHALLPLLGLSAADEGQLVFISGAVYTSAQMAFLIAVNRLPLILDEQTLPALAKNSDIILSAVVGHGVFKIHAPRYGALGEVRFKNQRGIIIGTNARLSEWLRRVREHASDVAYLRRILEIQWENVPLSSEAFVNLPAVKPIIGALERAWRQFREEFARCADVVCLAKKLMQALSQLYNVNLSAFVTAVEEVERRWRELQQSIVLTDADFLRERAYEVARQQLGASGLTATKVLESILENPEWYGVFFSRAHTSEEKAAERRELEDLAAKLSVSTEHERLARLLKELADRELTRVVLRAHSPLVPGAPRVFLSVGVNVFTKDGVRVHGYSLPLTRLVKLFITKPTGEGGEPADGGG